MKNTSKHQIKWEWLEYCEIDETLLMFCKWCKEAKYDNIFTQGTSTFKRDIVKCHEEKDQRHQRAKQQFGPILTDRLFESDLKVIHQMNLITKCNNISLTPQPLKFPTEELSESNNYRDYLNSTAARKFIEAIVHIIETNLINEIQISNNWSIMIDERLIKLEDCGAKNIMKKLETFITQKKLSITNIAHFGSDRASTMTVHCIAYRLHLAGQDAAKEVPYFKEYEAICKSLYNYFSSSYKQMLNLKMIQETNDDPQLNLLNIINTRWLSMSNAVRNLHQILDSVKDALNYDVITAKNKQDQKKAKELLNNLDPNFTLITKFLADLMFILTKLINIFQRDYVNISDVQFNLDITISTITTQFIGNENATPTYGTFLREYLEKNSINSAQIPSSITEFAKAIIKGLKSRFPNTSLYNSMKIFEPNLLPRKDSDFSNYGEAEIELLANFYDNDKQTKDGKIVTALIDKQELKQEWRLVKEIIKTMREFNLIEG
ncbi:334_t:CDS:2 [Cetraspora pellucida]|uniref:334_t:CDS:1 n=1 Tax=Cetraspora pellucida TaxID=1433469 RepID=A0ACA9KQZ0_9GLOM|nr:334_t:CDS:2 [Cetraspora pellucida]